MAPTESAPDCIFCKIAAGTIPAKLVHEDALCVAFEDLRPQAPTHVLVIPRAHLATTDDLAPAHEPMVAHLVTVAAAIARQRGLAATGYRTVINCGAAAGQTVFHIHVHLLGGRSFGWPPG